MLFSNQKKGITNYRKTENMKKHRTSQFLFLLLILFFTWACKTDKQWKGQEPLIKVNTETRPIQYQLKKTWNLGNGIYCTNDFDGSRLNGIVLTGDTLITALITAENTPINSSPWYGFKMWADTVKNITLKITYSEGVSHRYFPKISYDGKNWNRLDSVYFMPDTVSILKKETPKFCTLKLTLSSDTLWISGQELIVSKEINIWADSLAKKPFVSLSEIGKSFESRPIPVLQIGNSENKNLIMVLSRQHPPEVSGWLAMKWFVETLCAENETSEIFRENYTVFVLPLVNPDGVDNGNWRHNSGGIDLNRDWEDFNQPETQAIKRLMEKQVANGAKFYFAVDFHSTQQDIYYTIDPKLEGNMPGLVPELIKTVGNEIEDYEPNIRPNDLNEPKISSTSFFFHEYGAESVTFEIGDETPRDFIKKKGELTAKILMEILNNKSN